MGLTKILFRNENALGDILMMTCAIRDFKKAFGDKYECKVATTCMHVWDNNPYLSQFSSADRVVFLGPKRAVQGSNTSGLHYANGFRLSIEQNLGIHIPQGHIKADLHLTDQEKKERIIEGRYWILVSGGKRDQFTSKVWPYERWQKVVEMLPHITFVQLGASRDNHKPLKGNNVINLINKTEDPHSGLRNLFKLFYHADGSAGLVSMHMHLAAAFDKASVIVAGAREPVSFERYNHHQYLANQGTLRCNNFCKNCTNFKIEGKTKKCKTEDMTTELYMSKKICHEYDPIDPTYIKTGSCWRSSIGGCPNQVHGYARCLMLISPEDVAKGIMSYYDNGALTPIKEYARLTDQGRVYLTPMARPIFKMVANAHAYGGGERSTIWIMKQMQEEGYDIHFASTKNIGQEFKKNMPKGTIVTNKITDPCDVFMIYANDMIWDFKNEPYLSLMPNIKATKRVMMLNYKIGEVGKIEWTKHFDLYGFLCSQLMNDFIKKVPDAKCFVLPPPVEIEHFLNINPQYDQPFIHLVRHSSQGDSKYPKELGRLIGAVKSLQKQEIIFSFMPGPSFLNGNHYNHVYQYKYNELPVDEYLKRGSCYWYILPENYSDQGPRVVIEAMAAGLPVIADNRWGAKDRVTPETGWLCDSEKDHIDAILGLTYDLIREKGKAAKERASVEFDPYRWIETLRI